MFDSRILAQLVAIVQGITALNKELSNSDTLAAYYAELDKMLGASATQLAAVQARTAEAEQLASQNADSLQLIASEKAALEKWREELTAEQQQFVLDRAQHEQARQDHHSELEDFRVKYADYVRSSTSTNARLKVWEEQLEHRTADLNARETAMTQREEKFRKMAEETRARWAS